MKPIKTASLAAVLAALALGAVSARAAITIVGTSDSTMKFNYSATVQTNKPTTVSGDTYKYTIGKLKMNNKDLLAIFAEWTTNSLAEWQAAGAQLVWDWYSDQICVADKTGSNILFYAYDGIDNGTVGAYVYLDWNYGPYVYTETYVNDMPGGYKYTEYMVGYMQFYYYDDDSEDYVSLAAYGPSVEKYKRHWSTTTMKESVSDSFKPYGGGSFFDYSAIISGKLSGKGSWTYSGPS
jgi:hypothetical protein